MHTDRVQEKYQMWSFCKVMDSIIFLAPISDNVHWVLPRREAHLSLSTESFLLGLGDADIDGHLHEDLNLQPLQRLSRCHMAKSTHHKPYYYCRLCGSE